MYYGIHYNSPIGDIYLLSDETSLLGLWNSGQKYFGANLLKDAAEVVECTAEEIPQILQDTVKWLDEYFSGAQPEISRLKLTPIGSAFRQTIWQILTEIPYGKTITYGEIGKIAAKRLGKGKMSAQAVGGAVGHNPISIIIPCHRVVGSDGSLTGYAGGIEKKIKLLEHEGADMSGLYIPKKGTAR